MDRVCTVGDVTIGAGGPLTIIAGPCTLESRALGLEVGHHCKGVCDQLGLPYIFKASFDKANRSSMGSRRGVGLERGLDDLRAIRDQLGVPITTDIHGPDQADPVARAVDLLQIPAFLCRQTDLVVAAAEAANTHGRGVNIKKGQFLAPLEMRGPTRKATEGGCENLLLTERGTFFGYHRLVNDFIGVADLMELDCSGFAVDPPVAQTTDPREDEPGFGAPGTLSPPVCFDVTHSTQLPGSGDQTGGRPDRAGTLAGAAAAIGVHALFIECHPNPREAWSDGATQLGFDAFERVLARVAAIRGAL